MFELDPYKVTEVFGIECQAACRQLCEASFVDGVWAIVTPAATLCQACTRAIAIINKAFEAAGFVLNYSQGKSEAFLHFYGPSAGNARVHLHKELQGIIKFKGY